MDPHHSSNDLTALADAKVPRQPTFDSADLDAEPRVNVKHSRSNSTSSDTSTSTTSSAASISAKGLRELFLEFHAKLRETSPLMMLWVTFLIILVTAGDAMQIIFLNYWLRQYPKNEVPGNYTTFAVSGLLFSIFFLIALAVYVIIYRPNMRFATHLHGWILLFGIGTMDTVNSGLAIYSANRTSEILEAVFTSVTPLFTAIMAKIVLRDRRSYFSRLLIASMILIIAGLLVASAYTFNHSDNEYFDGSNRWWALIYFLSVPPNVLMNVWQAKYMMEHTEDPEFERWMLEREQNASAAAITVDAGATHDLEPTAITPEDAVKTQDSVERDPSGQLSSSASSTQPQPRAARVEYHREQGGDTIVKIFMLAADTTFQSLQTLMLLPADAIPWWGGSASVHDAGVNFGQGMECLVHCHNNFLFCCLYSLGFIFTYIGGAYLNHYSVTLCSMVTQIASPLTALLLIIIPSINLSGTAVPWYYSVIAVVLLIVGSLTYTLWDTKTEHEKQVSEFMLKQRYVKARVVPDESPVDESHQLTHE